MGCVLKSPWSHLCLIKSFFVMCDFYIFGVNCFYGRFYLMYFVFIICHFLFKCQGSDTALIFNEQNKTDEAMCSLSLSLSYVFLFVCLLVFFTFWKSLFPPQCRAVGLREH